MIKALMIITMVSGAEYTAQLPSMDVCMNEKAVVLSQNDVRSAACIPSAEQTTSMDKFKEMMNMFQRLVDDMQQRALQESPKAGIRG